MRLEHLLSGVSDEKVYSDKESELRVHGTFTLDLVIGDTIYKADGTHVCEIPPPDGGRRGLPVRQSYSSVG